MHPSYEVFISHSSQDHNLAYAICHYLEERDIRCWIAPRDVQGGIEYAEAIIHGIRSCKVMVVLFNDNANKSLYVKNEVERAFNYKSIIIPFKTDETIPSAAMELFLGSVHWLDAVKGRAEDYFDILYQNCARSLGKQIILTNKNNNANKIPPQNEDSIKHNTENNLVADNNDTVQIAIYEKNDSDQITGNIPSFIKIVPIIVAVFSFLGSLLYMITNINFFGGNHQAFGYFLILTSIFGIIWTIVWLYQSINKQLKKTLCIIVLSINFLSLLSAYDTTIDREEIPVLVPFEDEFQEVSISNRRWMSGNLDVDVFRNGDSIPEAKTNEDWRIAGEKKQAAWCYANQKEHGRLYNWYAVNDIRGLAPDGYRVANKEDFESLINASFSNSSNIKDKFSWNNETNGNVTGFSAKPTGFRTQLGEYMATGTEGSWWTCFSNEEKYALRIKIEHNSNDFNQMTILKEFGFSVRCIKQY